jgi:hypothetical protein
MTSVRTAAKLVTFKKSIVIANLCEASYTIFVGFIVHAELAKRTSEVCKARGGAALDAQGGH